MAKKKKFSAEEKYLKRNKSYGERRVGNCIQLRSRRDYKLEKDLRTISPRRRKSIKLRPLTDYSDAEILAARQLDPHNTELFVEARSRGLLPPCAHVENYTV